MVVRYDPTENLDVDLRVGNGIECKVWVWLYDEDGKVIPGDLPNTTAMFEIWADNDDAPEYAIPKKILAANSKLKLVQVYQPGQIGTGTFTSVTIFKQSGKLVDVVNIDPMDVAPGDEVTQRIKLEPK